MVSKKPSPSSSISKLSPIPSLSVSVHSEGSLGNASEVSSTPSLSLSRLELPQLDPPEPGDTSGVPQTWRSSVMVIFTVVEAVFPELSVIE